MCAQWLAPFDPQVAETDPSVKTHAVHCGLIKLGPLGSIVYFSGNKWDDGNHDTGQVDHTALYDCARRVSTRPGSPTAPGGLDPDHLVDVFCSGHALLPDGRLLVAGGTSLMQIADTMDPHNGHWGGLREAFIFDPAATPKWTALPSMNYAPPDMRPDPNTPSGGGRWYPSFLTLGDGSVIGFCGHPRIAPTSVDEHPDLLGSTEDDYRHNNNTPEIFSLGAGAWDLLPALGEGLDHDFAVFFPRVFVLPTGLLLIAQPLFESGPHTANSLIYDPYGRTVVTSFPGPQLSMGNGDYLNPGYAAQHTTGALLPLLPEDGYAVRVLLVGGANARITTITAGSEGSSAWAVTAPRGLATRRNDASAVLLPTGQVFVCGGVDLVGGGVGWDAAHAVLIPEIFDPVTNTWTTLTSTPATVPREYHSSALLLPDGRVWTAGSEIDSIFGAGSAEYRVELFEPDYIAAAHRPTITDAPPSVGYGESFTLHYTIPAASAHQTITRVAVTRCGAATHGFDYDQRYVGLTFTSPSAGMLQVTAPPDGNIAVPGQYLLWILDDGGRPCITAPFMRIAGILMEAVLDRSTFSIDDVNASAVGGSSTFSSALYVVFDGFIPSEVPATAPTVNFSVMGITATLTPAVAQPALELPGSPQLAQRVTFTYDITFTGTQAFNGLTDPDTSRPVDVTIQSQYHHCAARLDLILTPNPYMMDGAVSYLSTDLRVFRVHPGDATDVHNYIPGYTWSGAHAFIQDLIDHLNANTASSSTWFQNLPTDEGQSWISLMPTDDNGQVFDFALARVRRDSSVTDPAADAKYVRILWRVFRTMQPALPYDTTGLYRRVTNPITVMGTTVSEDALPLLGINSAGEAVAIPFFAEPRVSNMTAQTDPKNRRTLAAVHPSSLQFYGCFLDINQSTKRFPPTPGTQNDFTSTPQSQLSSIQDLMTGFHQCLVAEVHYKHDPASPELPQAGDTPASSDKLSQRNLSFDSSANPGSEVTRTVQHSFELHATIPLERQIPIQAIGQRPQSRIDALVVWWGNVPRQSIATFHFPSQQVSAILAAQRPDLGQTLEAVDAHTLRCRVIGDCLYLPVIPDAHQTVPALLTIELPRGVRRGEQYQVKAMQFRGGRVLGAFEFRINVKGNEAIIYEDRNKLALLRHLLEVVQPVTNPWRSIFQRWATMTAARLEAFGVDAGAIQGSPNGAPPLGGTGGTGAGSGPGGCGCLGWLVKLFS
jgi:hypothetical protein